MDWSGVDNTPFSVLTPFWELAGYKNNDNEDIITSSCYSNNKQLTVAGWWLLEDSTWERVDIFLHHSM